MEDNYKNNMVFGIHPVLELIRSQKEIEKVYIQGGTRSPEIAEIANTCRANGVPVQFVPIEKMNRLTRKNHQGVVAFICPIEYQPLEKVVQMVFEDGRDPFVLMLDRVTDVRNFGAMPIAMPPAASNAANEVVLTPRVLTLMTTSRMVSVMETNDEMNEANVGSV